jgi:starch phosphorylase
VETTLARSLYNCDELAAYSGTALAFRDRLIIEWNKTQQRQSFADQKRVYYLSLEFLMGRALDNAMLNVGMKDAARGRSSRLHLAGPLNSKVKADLWKSWVEGSWFSN